MQHTVENAQTTITPTKGKSCRDSDDRAERLPFIATTVCVFVRTVRVRILNSFVIKFSIWQTFPINHLCEICAKLG